MKFLQQPILKAAVVALLSLGLGLQWAAVQGIAWVNMTRDYLQQDPALSPLAAAAKAVEGQEPCSLCLMVMENAPRGDAPAQETPTKVQARATLDCPLPGRRLAVLPPRQTILQVFAEDLLRLVGLLLAPPVPPPRWA